MIVVKAKQNIRRVPEKSFRDELRELAIRYNLPPDATGLMQIHWNNGFIDWTKMELNNQF